MRKRRREKVLRHLHAACPDQSYASSYHMLCVCVCVGQVFDRERQDGMYTPSAYLVAHFLSSLPFYIVQPLLYVSTCTAVFEISTSARRVIT